MNNMTRNVGVTLTDLAYQVWIIIPHGQRSQIISEFLTDNADALSKLRHKKRRFKKFQTETKETTKAQDITRDFVKDLEQEETEETESDKSETWH